MEIWKKQNGKPGFTMRTKEAIAGLLFVLPFLCGFFVLFLPMIVESLKYSFSDMEVTLEGYVLTMAAENGLAHYIKAFAIDPEFNLQLLSSIGGMLVQIPMVLIFSFFAATLLNHRAILFAPAEIPLRNPSLSSS